MRKIGGGNSGRKWSGKSKSRSNRVRSRCSCFLISSMWNFGKSMPPSGWFGCGSGKKPFGKRSCSRTLGRRHVRRAASQVVPRGSFARTPPCTALPRDIVTPCGRLVGQVVALVEQRLVLLHDAGLRLAHARADRLERLGLIDGRIAGLALGRRILRRGEEARARDHERDRQHREACSHDDLLFVACEFGLGFLDEADRAAHGEQTPR